MPQLNKISDLIPYQKEKDSIFSKLFTRKISRIVSFLLLKYFKNISPNTITTISFILGIIACLLFFSEIYGVRILGILLLQLSFVFDCADGEIARYKNISSSFGAWLDSAFDRIKEIMMFVSLTYLTYIKFYNLRFLLLGFLVIILWQFLAYLREAKRSFWQNLRQPEFFITKNIYLGTVDIIVYLVSFAVLLKLEEHLLVFLLIIGIPLLLKQFIGAFKLPK